MTWNSEHRQDTHITVMTPIAIVEKFRGASVSAEQSIEITRRTCIWVNNQFERFLEQPIWTDGRTSMGQLTLL